MNMNPAFQCPVGGCEMQIPALTTDIQNMFSGTHTRDAHDLVKAPLEHSGSGETGPKAQKLQRPSIPEECSESEVQ